MKNMKWRVSGLIILIVLLASSLSYLALNKTSITDGGEEQEEPSMSIALVNEDNGTLFNDEEAILGNELTKSMTNNERHEWFVVSRGVAENGIERDVYDMMIIIPTNFSEKSLAFHDEKPEPVSLHYKINTTGHENVRATAEKTARNILSDFNKKLINVYFASIIGNLQDAQDNISEIVQMDQNYMNKYINDVNSPLSNYTEQFGSVQNYTDISKTNFQYLNNVLQTFETSLADDIKVNQDFASEIDHVIGTKEEASNLTELLSEHLNDFIQRMLNQKVSNNLASLQMNNKLVLDQFNYNENQDYSVVDHSTSLQKQLRNMNEFISSYKENLENKLNIELKENIDQIFADNEIDESYTNTMRDLFKSFDFQLEKEIEEQITNIPILSLEAIEESELVDERKSEIKKIAEVVNQYIVEKDLNYYEKNQDVISEEIRTIKNTLSDKGTIIKDQITLPEEVSEEMAESRYLYISVPEMFIMTEILIDGQIITDYEKNGIELTKDQDKYDLEVAIRLKPSYRDELDIMQAIEWQWAIVQDGIEVENFDIKKIANITDVSSTKDNIKPPANLPLHYLEMLEYSEEKSKKESSPIKDPLSKEFDKKATENKQESEEQQAENGNSDQQDEGDVEEENENENDDSDTEESEEPEEPEEPSEEIVVTNNYVYKKIQSPLGSKLNERIINKNIEQINSYYQVQALIEQYYGFDISEIKLNNEKLKNLAVEDSLYYFIHHNKIEDVLRDYLVNNIKDEMQGMMSSLNTDINEYIRLLSRTNDKSEDLVKEIFTTRKDSRELNEDIHELLEELSAWAKTSEAIIENNRVVVSHDGELSSAVMNLDSNYQPLLLSSESLRERANDNVDSANNVYESLNTIDEQAEEIKTSGSDIVSKGNELAENLIQNNTDNANFAENFSEVLDNSRIRDRQNTDLYQFLSNPVHIENKGIIQEENSLSPYFIVIVLFVTTLFTAYVLHSFDERKLTKVKENQLFIVGNLSISGITAGVGLVLGLLLSLISFYVLKMNQSQLYLWSGIIALSTMMLLFLATYLLRQLKTLGMFILLAIFSLYLLVTRTLGFHFEQKEIIQTIQKISPLQYVENLVSILLVNNNQVPIYMFILLILFTVIGYVLNLVVYRKPLALH